MEEFYQIDGYPFNRKMASQLFKEFINDDKLGKAWLIYHQNELVGYVILTFVFSFEYQGKIQGDILGELIDKYGRYYGNALAIVDCIGSSGDAAVLKLQSLGYPNLYYDDQTLKNVTAEN